MPLRAAIYARRSTDEHQAASLDVQLEEAQRYVERKGWSLAPDHIYIEDAVSRAEFKKRPALIAMLVAAESKNRPFDVIVVRDETRLGGDMTRTTMLIQDIVDAGVKLVYYFSDELVELKDATARFMVAARNFAAELEREKISQRTREHLLVKARRGLNVGGRCFGYDNVEVKEGDHRVRVEYTVNATQAGIVREIFQRYAAGEGLRSIVKTMNARGVPSPSAGKRGTGSWSTSAVWSMLRRERYNGRIVWGRRAKLYRKGTKVRVGCPEAEWTVVEAPEMKIIDDDLWAAVQEQMKRNGAGKGSRGGRRPKYLLSGTGRCAQCGGPLTVVTGRDGKREIKVYVCAYHRERGESVCSNRLRRPVGSVNEAVVTWVRNSVLTEEIVLEALRLARQRLTERSHVTNQELPTLEKKAAKLRVEISKLVDVLAAADVNPRSVVQRIAEREEELGDVEARIRAAKAAPDAINLELRRMELEVKKRITDLRSVLERNPEEARAVMAALFSKLTFTPVQTADGPRYRIEGDAAIGRMVATEGVVSNVASPGGFEPPLAT